MTLTTDVGLPPTSYDAEEWLDFLLAQPSLGKAIEGVIEDYPHVLSEILYWAVRHHDRVGRFSDQAAKHLASENLTTLAKAYWTGFQTAVDPWATLPPPPAGYDHGWRPGDAF